MARRDVAAVAFLLERDPEHHYDRTELLWGLLNQPSKVDVDAADARPAAKARTAERAQHIVAATRMLLDAGADAGTVLRLLGPPRAHHRPLVSDAVYALLRT